MSTKLKISLIFIAIVIAIGFFISNVFNKDNNSDDEIQSEEQREDYENNNFNDNDDEVTHDLEDSVEEEVEEEVIEGYTEPDFNEIFIEKFGDENLTEASNAAGIAVGLWILGEANEEKWLEVVTAQYYKENIKNTVVSDGNITKNIDSIVVSPSQPTQENEMVFAVSAQWDVYVGVEKVSEQRKLFEVFVVEENGQWKVHDMMMY